jgi:GT2 family glycosyltransferase
MSRSTSKARLSVVVVSFNLPSLLTSCLEALTASAGASDVEILVVRAAPLLPVDHAQQLNAFPGVRFVTAPGDANVPRMRSIGIEMSRGDIVALIEDDCIVGLGWCEAVIAAHQKPDIAIGGAVEPGPYRRSLDWAVYFCEYARFMLPLAPNDGGALAGNNVSYKRDALLEFPNAWANGLYDVFLHWQWQKLGLPTRSEQTLVVTNVNSWSIRHVTSVPFHHGRAFAGQRCASRPLLTRVAFFLLAFSLPLLKPARIIRESVSRKRLIGRVIQAFPWIVVFTTSWSIGECLGYLSGPGDSPSRWR